MRKFGTFFRATRYFRVRCIRQLFSVAAFKFRSSDLPVPSVMYYQPTAIISVVSVLMYLSVLPLI